MWLMILLAVLSSSSINIGKALQKQASDSLPTFSLDVRVLGQFWASRVWLLGVICDLMGGIMTAVALGNAPVSVVQPVGSLGLVVLAIFSHYYLKETLESQQLVSAALCLVGTIGLGATSDGSTNKGKPVSAPLALGTLACFAAVLGCSTMWRRKTQTKRSASAEVHSINYNNVSCGLEAGGYFGLSAAVTRTGFLFTSSSKWWVPVGIVASIFLTGVGFTTMSQGFKGGNTVTICTFANVAAMVTGVMVGLIGLGEKMPSSTGLQLIRLMSWVLLGLGIASSSPGGLKGLRKSIKALLVGVWLLPDHFKLHARRLLKKNKEKPATKSQEHIPDV